MTMKLIRKFLSTTWVLCMIWAVLLLGVSIVLGLPLLNMRNNGGWSYFLSDNLVRWQLLVMRELQGAKTPMLMIAVLCDATTDIFFSFWKEIVLFLLAFHYYHVIQGWLGSLLPDWVSDNVPSLECMSLDSEPPGLEVDPAFLHISSDNDVFLDEDPNTNLSLREELFCPSSPVVKSSVSRGPEDKTVSTSSRQPGKKERHVFDKTFGVVPVDVLLRWKRQEQESLGRVLAESTVSPINSQSSQPMPTNASDRSSFSRESSIGSSEATPQRKQIPPVRYSSRVAPAGEGEGDSVTVDSANETLSSVVAVEERAEPGVDKS